MVRLVAKIMRRKYLFNSLNTRNTTHPLNYNAALFLRDVVIYMELSATIKAGEAQQVIMSPLLINTKDKDNSWIPSDLYQEHGNLLLNHVYGGTGSNASWESLSTHISINIRTLSSIKEKSQEEYKVPTIDIMRVWELLRGLSPKALCNIDEDNSMDIDMELDNLVQVHPDHF
ncbi:MAG: hypothetical protein J3Q66DRAFT_403694 [Benniella sp.]|nr:MAG: hypothetical protein J3Q66DRAFT_403694 [Benniella sp.]